MLTRVLLWLLLIALVLRALGRLFRGIVEGSAPGGTRGAGTATARPSPPARGEPMVKDPICGTFVVQSRALSARDRAGVHYFCSEKCRQAYTSR